MSRITGDRRPEQGNHFLSLFATDARVENHRVRGKFYLFTEVFVKLKTHRQYLSRRGERVLITAIEPSGPFPVRFVVLTGPYQGAGARDGSKLTRAGRFLLRDDGTSPDHWNDLIAEVSVS
jgi:hypothetical protein